MRSKKVFAAAILGLAASSTSPARASEWLGSFNNDWNNSLNWLGFSGPGPADSATFGKVNTGLIFRSAVNLSSSASIASMFVEGDAEGVGPYTFTRTNNAILTVGGTTSLGFNASAPLSTTTFNGFRLNTGSFAVQGAATGILTGGAVITTTGSMSLEETSVLNLPNGTLNLAADVSHSLFNSATLNVNGGTLNLGPNSTLNANDSSTLNFTSSFSVKNNSLLRAQGGGDIVSNSFIDVGNGGTGFLTVNQAGSTLTSQAGTSDWGRSSGSNAVVEIFTGGTASVSTLRVGTDNSFATLNVAGGTLNVGGTLTVGGGLQSRGVQVNVSNAGTMNVTGIATFDNQADVNLSSGTLDFNQNATFNAGSRLDITGGTLDTTNRTLTINGGTLTRTVASGTVLSGSSALIVQAGGTATFTDYLDVGNGNSAALTVSGAGSTFSSGGLSDWGRGAAGGAVVSIQSNGIATPNGLRIGTDNGSASVTVATGGQLKPNALTVGGGSNNRTVNLTINGGTLSVLDVNSITSFNDKAVLNLQAGTFDPKGNVTFFTGSTANISGGTFLTPSGKFLTVSGGVINHTNPAGTGTSPGSTLAINNAGKYDSTGSFSVGEFGGGTVTVDGANSRLWAKHNLTLGGTTAGQVGTVTNTNAGRIFVGDAAGEAGISVAVADGDPIGTNGGVLTIANGSTLTSAENAVIGAFSSPGATKRGRVIVTGTNSFWNAAGDIFVGYNGTGELNIQSGGRVRQSTLFTSAFGGNGTMNIASGGQLESTSQVVLADDVGTTSTATVTGTNSTIAVGTTLEAGRGGTATLNLSLGGTVSAVDVSAGVNAGAQGIFTIDGSNSMVKATNNATLNRGSTLAVTNNGTFAVGDASGLSLNDIIISDNSLITANAGGLLTLSGGSTATTLDTVFLSRSDTTSARLQITGTNSKLTGDTIFVAERGRADVRVEAGGQLVGTGQLQIGSEANAIGTATVTGTGSSATGGVLTVGLFSSGTLDVTAGGLVTATGNSVIGRFAAGVGTVNVTGAGSTFAGGPTLQIGHTGTATLSITAGGLVSATDMVAGVGGTGHGTVTIDGAISSLRASSNLTLDRGSTITTTNGGNVLVGDNATGFSSTFINIGDNNAIGANQGGKVIITNGSTLNHHSRVLVAGSAGTFGEVDISGVNSKFLVGERLIVGNNGVGRTTVAGGGLLKVDSYGITSANGSKIILNAGGTLEANANIANILGETRGYIATGYNGGNWLGNGLTSATAATDSRLGIGYRTSGALLTIKLALKGDTNLTNTVDFDDLLVLAQNYNLTNKFWQNGDFNYDGNVNFDDLLSLAQNYNQTLSVSQMGDLGSSFSSDWALARSMVPEPVTAGLLLLSVPMIARRRGTR